MKVKITFICIIILAILSGLLIVDMLNINNEIRLLANHGHEISNSDGSKVVGGGINADGPNNSYHRVIKTIDKVTYEFEDGVDLRRYPRSYQDYRIYKGLLGKKIHFYDSRKPFNSIFNPFDFLIIKFKTNQLYNKILFQMKQEVGH